MNTKKLISINVIMDNETGGGDDIGELDHGIPIATNDWLKQASHNRKKLANFLRSLADKCLAAQPPFE